MTVRASGAPGTYDKVLKGHGGTVRASSFSADGRWVAAGSDDATARIWDAATGEIRATLVGHTQPVNGVAFSPDGMLVATGSNDATARIWDAATGEIRATLVGHTRPVNGVAFSPDGKFIVTGSDDATAHYLGYSGRSFAADSQRSFGLGSCGSLFGKRETSRHCIGRCYRSCMER